MRSEGHRLCWFGLGFAPRIANNSLGQIMLHACWIIDVGCSQAEIFVWTVDILFDCIDI